MAPSNRREFLGNLALGSLGLGVLGPSALRSLGGGDGGAAGRTGDRPNIIVILADDMGFSDIGSYGGEVETPNLDGLAAGGLRFSQFYNAARCCPTRASLMTGLYNHQAGVGHMMREIVEPGYIGQLNDRCVTVAEALGNAGYRTAMSGKWHLSHLELYPGDKSKVNRESDAPFWDTKESWPVNRGFDEHFGTIPGVSSLYDPYGLVRNEDVIAPDDEDFYYTDAITDNAVRYIERFSGGEDPFFLYVAHFAPHWPLHALEEDIEKYRDRYMVGWDEIRERRHRRLVEAGLVDGRWPLTHRDSRVPAWEDAPNKEWEAHRMAVYAAMIDRMDQGIGRIMETLRRQGIEEDTLVLFLSDNGGCAEIVRERWYDIPTKTRDGRPIRVGNDPSVYAGPETTWQSYGPGWANASNSPFRLYKHWVHEGGIATPMIAHWPGRVRDEGGITHQPGHVIDIMATCLDAAGVEYPQTHEGRDILPLEGRSLLPVFRGERRDGHEALFWEHEGHKAVRRGKWKLVTRSRRNWELYDLEADRTEMNNQVEERPELAEDLAARYDAWAERSHVLPWEEYVEIRRRVNRRRREAAT